MSGGDAILGFRAEVERNVAGLASAERARALSAEWLRETHRLKYDYNFTWLGRPILQLPQDVIAIQEIVWSVRPELIVETGIAHGGSLVFHASLLEMLGGPGIVVGIDVDVRAHNRREIELHRLSKRIRMIEGSSVDPATVAAVREHARGRESVLVVLDSLHTHDHVLQELELYAPLVGSGSYVVVCDTIIEDLGPGACPGRPWGPGNSPATAVRAFLERNRRFEVDRGLEAKLLLTNSPGGYLRCVR